MTSASSQDSTASTASAYDTSDARRLLLIDDDRAFRSVYASLLRKRGYTVVEADDRASAAAAFARERFAVVLLDLMLPPDGKPEGGVEQLRAFRAERPETLVIVVSGTGDTHAMVGAIRDGAYDFITKPAEPDVVLTVVQRASQRALLEAELSSLRRSLSEARPGDSMIGESPQFRASLDLAARVAPSPLPVLILGDNGTGKEMAARFIHERSDRKDRPFVTVNCGAIPENLYESILFGHKRGAFTGAVKDHDGLFVQADGGTLFLDEIGDMPATLQVKLLRTLESGEVLPVGASHPITVDVRIVSATNQPLEAMQADGSFREDLYWRVKGAEMLLPPLRERTGDIPLLAAFFLNQSAALTTDGTRRTLSEAATERLLAHPWPGNLRELRHEMQRASVLAGDRRVIEPTDFSFSQRAASSPASETGTLAEKVEQLERREVETALSRHHNNRTKAAEELGLSRQGLLKKLARWGWS